MSTRTFTLVFAFLLSAGFASATINFVDISSSSVNISHGTSQEITFKINNTNATDSYLINFTASKWTTFSPSSIVVSNLSQSDVVRATISVPKGTSPSTHTITLTATGNSSGVSQTQSITVNVPISTSLAFSPSSISTRMGNEATFTITNNGNTNNPITLSVSDSSKASLSANTYSGQPIVITPLDSSFVGDLTIIATQNGQNFSLPVKYWPGLCSPVNSNSNLTLSNIDLSNRGEGEDHVWYLLDELKVEVDVGVKSSAEDQSGIYVVMGLFDSAGKDVSKKLSYISKGENKVKAGSIDAGDDKPVIFQFKVPGEIKPGTYTLVFKAYNSESGCTETVYSTQIRVKAQDDDGKFIGFSNIKLSQNEAVCGDLVILTADVTNIGTEDQDKVKVKLYNKDLGITKYFEIGNGLDTGDSQSVSFEFQVPFGIADKTYNFELTSEYGYDDDDDTYDDSSDYTEYVPLKVFGCGVSSTGVSLSASLQSDVKAGENLVVGLTLRNTGSSSAQYTIDVRGYSEWAILNSISQSPVNLGAGESKTIQITLVPNEDVKGSQSFIVEVRSGNNVQTKQIEVEFPGRSIKIWDYLKENELAWIIGLVNVILIILIIIVAVKLSRN